MTLHRQRTLLAITGSLVLATAVVGQAPTSASTITTTATTMTSTAESHARASVTVAHALNSPRLISVGRHGTLYVAEAGSGGGGPCVTGETGKVCFGRTGSIMRIRHGHQHRVLRRLPSLAGPGGQEAIGPEDVLVRHGHYVISMGIGQDTRARHSLGARARTMGTLLSIRFGHRHPRILADIARFEARHNPDHSTAHDSDPAGILRVRHGFLLADAGGNTLLHVWSHHVRTRAVFPDRIVTLPPQVGGGSGPMQAVPTAVAKGPDGAFYVSQLTGFPFPPGAAHIFRVVAGHRPTVFASGLTNVTDLAWYRHRLYAVQISDAGLLNETGLPMGSLVRVHRGRNAHLQAVAAGLPAPYGVAMRNDIAFVTTCTVCPGHGAVVRIPLG
jgi:hypothetical protein